VAAAEPETPPRRRIVTASGDEVLPDGHPVSSRRPSLDARRVRRLSIAAFLAMLLAVFGLIGSRHVLARALPAILCQAFALGVFAWARLALGLRSFHFSADPTPGGLVTSGPYRFVRHPIYAALCLFAWAGALDQPSPLSLVLALVFNAGAVVRLRCEERLLLEKYPAYRAYAASTPALIPRPSTLLPFRRRRSGSSSM
jgi:protein-S-isoprenylcysteine O-methyltransferase Ste14